MTTPQQGPSITEAQVVAAVRAYLLANLPPSVEVMKGQANRVAETKAPDFVIMVPAWRRRLGTTIETWDQTDWQISRAEPMLVDMQLDFHGEASTDNATVIQILWRSAAACDFLAPFGVAPLYCDDGQQMPFINDQNQYEDRWIMNLTMQINPAVSTAQQFAASLAVDLVEVDVTPPAEHRNS